MLAGDTRLQSFVPVVVGASLFVLREHEHVMPSLNQIDVVLPVVGFDHLEEAGDCVCFQLEASFDFFDGVQNCKGAEVLGDGGCEMTPVPPYSRPFQ
jgi:hypothetical protein